MCFQVSEFIAETDFNDVCEAGKLGSAARTKAVTAKKREADGAEEVCSKKTKTAATSATASNAAASSIEQAAKEIKEHDSESDEEANHFHESSFRKGDPDQKLAKLVRVSN